LIKSDSKVIYIVFLFKIFAFVFIFLFIRNINKIPVSTSFFLTLIIRNVT